MVDKISKRVQHIQKKVGTFTSTHFQATIQNTNTTKRDNFLFKYLNKSYFLMQI